MSTPNALTTNPSNLDHARRRGLYWPRSTFAAHAWWLALTLVAGAGHATQSQSTTVDAGTAGQTAFATAVAIALATPVDNAGGTTIRTAADPEATLAGQRNETAPAAVPDRAALERKALMPTPSRGFRAPPAITTTPQNRQAAAALGLQLPNDLRRPAAEAAVAGQIRSPASAISAAVDSAVAAADGRSVMTSEVIDIAPATTAARAQGTPPQSARETSLPDASVAAAPVGAVATPAVAVLEPTAINRAQAEVALEGIAAQSPMAMLLMSGCALLLLGVLCGLRYILVPGASSDAATLRPRRAEPFNYPHDTNADLRRQHEFASETCESGAGR